MQRINAVQAGEMLNMTPVAVRYLMTMGKLDIGFVKPSSNRNQYIIYKELVQRTVAEIEGANGSYGI